MKKIEFLLKNINKDFFSHHFSCFSHYQKVQLSVMLAKDVLPNFEQAYPNDNRPRLAIEAAEAWLADPSEENAEKAREAGDAAEVAYYAAEVAYYAAWAAASAAKVAAGAAAWAAWVAGWVAVTGGTAYYAGWVVYYNAISKFYKTIPDKQKFIETIGRGRELF